jgi:hypothetical protein
MLLHVRPLGSLAAVAAVGTIASVALSSCGDDGAVPEPGDAFGYAGAGGAVETGAAGGEAPVDPGGGEGGGETSAFALEVHTELGDDGALMLRTNLPSLIDECLQLDGPICEDLDSDGLTDGWEDVVLDRLRPLVRLDEAETLVGETAFGVGLVGRVTPISGLIHVYMMLGYAKDFGNCGGLTSHNGDSERVALAVERLRSGAGDVRVTKAYTAAHEGTVTDHGMVFEGESLGELVHEIDAVLREPRWTVYASADKHATYASVDICEGISVLPCFDEDCGVDEVSDPAAFELLMPYANAGEPDQPLVTGLEALGFPGDDAWLDQPFCGGLGGSGCSSSVRSKLVTNPF